MRWTLDATGLGASKQSRREDLSMYEIWVNQETPSLHLVKAADTPFPAVRSLRDWSLLGASRVAPDLAAIVDRQGFEEVTTVRPFDPQGLFDGDREDAGPGATAPR